MKSSKKPSKPQHTSPSEQAILRRDDYTIPSAEFVCWPGGLKLEKPIADKARK